MIASGKTIPSNDAHTFGEWIDIGNGQRSRVCTTCAHTETVTDTLTDPPVSNTGCQAALPLHIVMLLPLIGACLAMRKRKNEE
jgi:hypothetical protein